MAGKTFPEVSNQAVLLFGSLALSFNAATFEQLRTTVTRTSSLMWLLDALLDLVDDSETALAIIPVLKQGHTRDHLLDVRDALATGRSLRMSGALPNTVLIPLVVASQLAQYATLQAGGDLKHEEFVSARNGEILGFCTGLLGAYAVASSYDQADFRKYGAVAVRLGMLIGLVVDLGDAINPSKSVGVGWSSLKMHEAMIRTFEDMPKAEAYTSVSYDTNRATITATAREVPQLLSKLRALGLTASEMSLYGRFHTQANSQLLEQLLAFCDNHARFQLSDASHLAIPARSGGASGQRLTQGALHTHALRAILVDSPTWFKTLTTTLTENNNDNKVLLCIGAERCVPPSVLRTVGSRLIHFAESLEGERQQGYPERSWQEDDIAVVGMACKLPGANDVAEFWDLLASARPQHQEIGTGHRDFNFDDTPTRSAEDPGMRRKWFANLVSDVDQFDHRFFKKTPRESASMDPAQRFLLQVAYQAVEQSGYLNGHLSSKYGASDRNNVGVFLGTTGNDYQANAASQAANAFTTTGNLQGFLAGKVSHHFGWTGPAMVVDTACSGSLVAIHQACLALASGECSAALAGGAHILTQPAWFQNLAAGQFLSPTGQCKPFDAGADGYCRGEGVAAVFLKRMDRAVADGDAILGVIAATAVQQNQNCTPIFVPNMPSLTDLFRTVTTKARVHPSQVSVVEAHGTGTPVGDPAEYASIKAVLGGTRRPAERPLALGSVKGLVGHLEGSSGVVALVKLLLMLHVGLIPPQASFTTINPAIGAGAEDNMTVHTEVQPWDADFRMGLINNYGASGSNASMILAQPPLLQPTQSNLHITVPVGVRQPFWISANDTEGIHRRAQGLRKYLGRLRGRQSLANLSYNVGRQNNRGLEKRMVFSVASLADLDSRLGVLEKEAKGEAQPAREQAVVLCFGGQVSTFVGLDRQLYEGTALFKSHIDRVDAVALSLGASSIFPVLFQRTPIDDTVRLQLALFALQYACARSWLDSGVKPAAVVGHSFGELTALCISQTLSLEDTVRMIIDRATLVRDMWGPDKGAMMAIAGTDLANVRKLLLETQSKHGASPASPASVACYNGPRSFTLAGSTTAIEAVAEAVAEAEANGSLVGIKVKRLNVSNAFHCALVDDLIDQLEQGAQGLTFRDPVIPLERAVESPTPNGKLGPKFVADHMRSPVFFSHAVERLVTKHATSTSSLVFLEVGSNSTITNMASRALADAKVNMTQDAHFQAVNITNCDDGWNKLVDTTLALWRAGLAVNHWAHHPLQARASVDISTLLLPPYPFDADSRHWISLKIPPKHAPALPATSTSATLSTAVREEDVGLVIFAGYQDGSDQGAARFRINTSSPKFEKLLAGHMTLQTAPICPATVQIGLVVDGIESLRPTYQRDGRTPQFLDIQYQSPVCASSTVETWIETREDGSDGTWSFEVFSAETKAVITKDAKMLHTTGRIVFLSADDASLQRELAYFPRLFGHGRATELLTRPDADEVLGHHSIYRLFAEIVDYGDEYRSLRKLVGCGNEAAGVVRPVGRGSGFSENGIRGECGSLSFDPHLSDAFCQVAGVWANFLTNRASSDAYLANGIAQWIRAPAKATTPDELHVFATTQRSSGRLFLSDVFVFDAADGSLLEVILGIAYVQIPKNAMNKLLRRLSDPRWLTSTSNGTHKTTEPRPVAYDAKQSIPKRGHVNLPLEVTADTLVPLVALETRTSKSDPKEPEVEDNIFDRVKTILADISGLESHEIKANSELADLGIDSLVGMELINELEAAFETKLPENEIQAVVDVPGLMKCLLGVLGVGVESDENESVGDGEDSGDTSTPIDLPEPETGRTTPGSDVFPAVEKEKSTTTTLPFDAVMGAFKRVKARTDKRIADVGQTRYVAEVLPLQDDLTVALTLEAFEELGAGIRTAGPGQRLVRIPHGAQHRRLVTYLYRMLESLTQVIKVDGEDTITRTAVPLPPKSSRAVHDELAARFPDQRVADELTYYAGSSLASVLAGQQDAVKLIFGSPRGRELAARFYGEWPLNRATYAGVEDFLTRLVAALRTCPASPLRILEMGAGTGGTTKRLVPLLAKLGVDVEYTFTDLSPSLVAQARKLWAKQYPFMRFVVHDIEKQPIPELVGTQHLVVASNAVHATRSLGTSTRCIREVLRPDGFLCLIEMTRPMYWVDIVFGLFEGWWMQEDGREHVIAHEQRWEADLRTCGYGHVDWIDGESEESKIWKFIIAAADPESR